jgi:hypothetical protein
VPATGPYFNAYPILPDEVPLTLGGGAPTMVKGVKIPIGGTRTIDVVMHSQGATAGPWTVAVQDLSMYIGDPAATQVSLDKTTVNDGDVVHLTIKVLAADPNLLGEGFFLSSTLGGQNNFWFGAVGQ